MDLLSAILRFQRVLPFLWQQREGRRQAAQKSGIGNHWQSTGAMRITESELASLRIHVPLQITLIFGLYCNGNRHLPRALSPGASGGKTVPVTLSSGPPVLAIFALYEHRGNRLPPAAKPRHTSAALYGQAKTARLSDIYR